MSSQVVLLNINPSVLKWAREEAGYSIPKIVGEIKTTESIYREWENSGNKIPFNTLKEFSRIYKRQISVFFLPFTPPKTIKPTDYRNITKARANLSQKTLLSMIRVDNFRDFFIEQNGYDYYIEKYKWLSTYHSKYNQLNLSDKENTTWIRELLNFTIDEQKNSKNIYDCYLKWRNAFENNLGIYVFQFGLTASEIQGYCYSENYPYCIVVNSNYPVSSRIFTLFHELGHILKRQSGLCLPDKVRDSDILEFECNAFSGRVLIPDSEVIEAHKKSDILKYSKSFYLSSEVYLRRLKSLKLISDDEFFILLKDIRSSIKQTKKDGFVEPVRKSISTRGLSLFNLVLNSLKDNKISYSYASDILDLKINNLISI